MLKFTRKKTLIIGSIVAVVGGFGIWSATATSSQVCTGKNLMAELAESSPKTIDLIRNSAQQISYGKGLLWKVEKANTKPSYYFGTMHMADPRLLDLAPKVTAAFDTSTTLALELTEVLDPEVMKEKAAGLAEFTIYTDGSTISSRLTPEEEKITKEGFDKRSAMPWLLAKRLKPWALMGAMALPACETARKEAGKPFLDQALAQRADKAGMKLVGLETVKSQVMAIAGLPEKTMIAALVETAKLGDRMDDVFETMIVLYEKEEIGQIITMMKHIGPEDTDGSAAALDTSSFQQDVIDNRNITMVKSSEPLLNAGGAFIAVGALHLPGEKGILNILVQKGYTITPQ